MEWRLSPTDEIFNVGTSESKVVGNPSTAFSHGRAGCNLNEAQGSCRGIALSNYTVVSDKGEKPLALQLTHLEVTKFNLHNWERVSCGVG